MPYRHRARFHRYRKKIARRIQQLWPQCRMESACTELGYDIAKRTTLGDPADLPSLGGNTLRRWQAEDDESYVRRFDGRLTVDPKTGILFLDKRVIWGSTDYPRERSPLFFRHLRAPDLRLPRAISLHHLFRNNYFHFINNIASKLMLVEQAGLDAEIPLLVPAELAEQGFFRDAQALGLFGDRPVIVQGRLQVIAADCVYVIKAHDCTEAAHEWLCDRLRVEPDPASGRWIYIQRGKRSPNARRYRNEAALHQLLAEHDIRIVDPQELSLAEQIALFSNARVVISPHGAGLTNIIFRRHAPCTVIEMFNPSLGTPHYYLIARQHGFEYIWIGNRNESQEKNSFASSEADLTVLAAHILQLKARLPGPMDTSRQAAACAAT